MNSERLKNIGNIIISQDNTNNNKFIKYNNSENNKNNNFDEQNKGFFQYKEEGFKNNRYGNLQSSE